MNAASCCDSYLCIVEREIKLSQHVSDYVSYGVRPSTSQEAVTYILGQCHKPMKRSFVLEMSNIRICVQIMMAGVNTSGNISCLERFMKDKRIKHTNKRTTRYKY